MIRTDDFASQALSYDDDDYFVARNQYVQQWDKFTAIFAELLEKIILYKTGGNFLDVGAGVGTLVAAAAGRGFAARGVEVSAWAGRFAREEKGLDVRTGLLEEAGFPDDHFDVITINHVLEHVPQPAQTIAEIRRILKHDGLLVIGVPNIDSLMAGLRGKKWASLRPAEHLWHFTPATLKKLLAQGGFRELYFESRENHPAVGWGLEAMVVRLINAVAVAIGRSEAMLLFSAKAGD
jgi:2-polyprenyl-3-methyl-5-hydroxy-6-metoxy-1,4-benzoquinol methylase